MITRLRWTAPQVLAAILAFCVPAAAAEDPYAAFRGLESRALAGDLDAMVRIADAYAHAEGLPRDPVMALHLYCAAAKRGHAGASYDVGEAYTHGAGVARDDDQAAAWFRLAAARGSQPAIGMLRLLGGRAPDTTATCPFGASQVMRAKIDAPHNIAALVDKLAPRHGLDPALVLAVIKVESDFRTRAVSSADAQGLMQLIPETAKRFGVKDTFDPVDNLTGGMKYLRWLLDRFDGDVTLTLAAYNAGENAVERHAGVPPYAETREYLKRFEALGAIPK